jgi:hypothetical protein
MITYIHTFWFLRKSNIERVLCTAATRIGFYVPCGKYKVDKYNNMRKNRKRKQQIYGLI